MSEENNHNSKKEKNQLSPSQLLEKYKFFYLVHGKSISEFSPDLNILLRKFLIKKIYDLSHSSPEIKQKSEEFLNSICGLEKSKQISLNFNADKLCKYEDFINFIEKSFEAAEEDFNDKIIQHDFSNYLQLIAVYRLINDMSDLIDCWKEKDENIQKFQTLCKYRCIQIITAKKDFENKPKTGIDKEIEQLSNDIKKEKDEPVDLRTDSQICNELLGDYNNNINNQNINFNKQSLSNSVMINRNNVNQNQTENKKDFNLIKKLTLFVSDGNNNNKSIIPKVNNYNLHNIKKDQIVNKDNNNSNSKTGNTVATNYIDNKVNNPYSKLTQSFSKAIKNEQKVIDINSNYSQINTNIQNPYEQFNNNNINNINNNNNINNINNNININNINNNNNNDINNPNQQNNNLFNNQFGNFNQQYNQQEFGGFNNYNNQNQQKIDPKLLEYQKQVQQQYNNNYSYRYIPPKPKTQSILPQRKIIVKKKDKEELEIEKMLGELKGNPQKNISDNNQRKSSFNNNNHNNNKVNINKNQENKNIQNTNQKKEQVIISNPLIVPTEFKQQTTNLLNNFKYKKEKKLDIELPVVFRDVDYIYLLSHIKQEMIPDIINLIEKNNLEKALSQSELILYYLTNIIPKE